MTEEPSPIDSDVLTSLRKDARVPVPRVARERVSARLVAAGVAVVSAASGVSTAAANADLGVVGSEGVGTGAAGTGIVGSTATPSGFIASSSLAKTVIVGIMLGGAGLAAYVTRGGSARETPRPAELAPARGAKADAAERKALPVPQLPATPPSATVTFEELEPAREPSRAPAPRASGGAASSRLAEQQALLDEARSALRAGDSARALATLARHRASFPQTAFDEERRALEIRALLASGSVSEASERLTSFERRFGQSLQLPSLRRSVAAAERNVTDSVSSDEFHQHEDGTP